MDSVVDVPGEPAAEKSSKDHQGRGHAASYELSKLLRSSLPLFPWRFPLVLEMVVVSHLNLDTATFGPMARKKIMSIARAQPYTSSSWPAGKTVKISFTDMDGTKATKNLMWKPDKEKLYQVITKATAAGVADLEVYYEDHDGDKIELDATESGIAEFLADHWQHPSPKLEVHWRLPTPVEKFQSKVESAKAWVIGHGGATDQAVQDALQKVELNGAKVTENSGSVRHVIEQKGCRKEEWPEVVENLKSALSLSEAEAKGLLNAAQQEEGKDQHFHQTTNGDKITTVFVAYHTIYLDDQIDLIFGKYEASMEVIWGPPGENCIQHNGTNFAAWPTASPHGNNRGFEVKGAVVEIPSGWQLVDSTQEGFDNIRKRVIAPYGWHTDVLVTSGADGQLQGWCTSRCGPNAGNHAGPASSSAVEKKDESRFHFKGDLGFRLLIQAKPVATPELINDWKRYVQLSAQREWSQQLGAPHVGSIQESVGP